MPRSRLSTRMSRSVSQTCSRASLCALPGSADSNASAQSDSLSQTSSHGVSTVRPSAGGTLVELGGALQCGGQPDGGLEARSIRIALLGGSRALGDEVTQGADLHAVLAEAGQDVVDVRQICLMRPDEQHAAPAAADARIGVEEVGRAVQGDHGLAGTGAAIDDERAPGAGADDGVLIGLDGGEHIPHPARPAAAEARDEGRIVIECHCELERFVGEGLVPVVADPAAAPAVPPAAEQPHRIRVRRTEERLGGGGAPVDQQLTAFAVAEPQPADVERLVTAGGNGAAEAEIKAEPAQHAEPAMSAGGSRMSRSIASWPGPPGSRSA